MVPIGILNQTESNPIDSLDDLAIGSRGALRHQIVKRLLHAIFRRTLPPGTRLMVMKLAHRFGTSSTPVREALVELEAVGVVQFIHNRGAIVSPFGSKELREIYQIRRVLEAEAARCACGRVDAQALESLRREFLALQGKDDGQVHWAQQALASDRRLHELIVRSSGSDRLMNEIRRYDGLVQTIREVIGDDRAAQHRALDEHLTIVAPLLAGVPQEAAEAMSRHIESAAESFEKAMFEGR